jgi:hypothetical protein
LAIRSASSSHAFTAPMTSTRAGIPLGNSVLRSASRSTLRPPAAAVCDRRCGERVRRVLLLALRLPPRVRRRLEARPPLLEEPAEDAPGTPCARRR